MTVFDMQELLRTTGSYVTPPEHRRRPCPWLLATPLFHLAMLPIFISGNRHAKKPDFEKREWAIFGFKMLRLTEAFGGVVTFSGFENVHRQPFPVVWAANHMSSLETYLLPSVLTAFSGLIVILKESLAHYPLFGQVVRSVRPIRVQRRSAVDDLRKVLTEGPAGVREGRSPLVFPQGQRMLTFDPTTFNSMGVKLAQKAGIPLVPLAVRADFLKISRLHRDLVTVHPEYPIHIACGPPISPDQSPRAMQEAATGFIESKLALWGRETGTPLLAQAAGLPS